MQIEPIARVRSPYPTKFGVPRQPGLVDALEATVVFEPAYRNADAVRGLEGFDYIWLLWSFSHNERAADAPAWSPTVRPPILGGTKRMGVFATRSSFRPNNLALSCVRLLEVVPDAPEGPLLRIAGVDAADDTPVFDVKPYLPYVDAHPEARAGWTEGERWPVIERVNVPPAELAKLPERLRAGLLQVLRQDPRPAYTKSTQLGRLFWVPLEHYVAWFRVDEIGAAPAVGEKGAPSAAAPAFEANAAIERGVTEGPILTVEHIEELSDEAYEQLKRTGSVEPWKG